MKITLNIDGALLDRVVKSTGSKTKTSAIDLALREMDRRAHLQEALNEGLGMTPDELENMFDPASDPMTLRAAEDPAKYNMESS
jgi:hypothetical protein